MALFITPLTTPHRRGTTSSGYLVDHQTAAPHLASRFRLLEQRFLWSRMALYADRLELRGLGWRGLFRQTVPLAELQAVIWWTGRDDCNLELRHADGTSLPIWTRAAGRWKYAIEAHAKACPIRHNTVVPLSLAKSA